MPTALATPDGFSFRRTVLSHGWCVLPPFRFDRAAFVLHRVLRLSPGRLVEVRLSETPEGSEIQLEAPALSRAESFAAVAQVRHMLRLDEDFTGFYAAAAAHPAFAWIPNAGAGRLLRAPTVYEDLVKLICTTNCTWSLTETVVRNLVAALGEPVDEHGPRAFPTPEAMAAKPARFFEKEVRAGYRAGALAALAEQVAGGRLDVEGWRDSSLPTAGLMKQILSVRGAGPYTAENLLKLLGRYEGLAIDSWCRAKYLRLYGGAVKRLAAGAASRTASGKRPARRAPRAGTRGTKAGKAAAPVTAALIDASMELRYGRFRQWRGLALWCDLTKDWLEDEATLGPGPHAKSAPAREAIAPARWKRSTGPARSSLPGDKF